MKSQPRIKIPLSSMERFFETAALSGVIIGFGLLVFYWSALPESVPRHFGLDGRPDAFGGKSMLLFLPIVGLVFYLSLTALGRFPHVLNYAWKITAVNARRQYYLARMLIVSLKAEMIWVFTYIEMVQVRAALNRIKGLGPAFIPVMFAVFFTTIGIYLYLAYKAR
jgi:hypothetical protein